MIVARFLVAAYERVEGEATPAKVSNALRALVAMDFGQMHVGSGRNNANSRYVDLTAISSKGGLVD